MFVVKSIQIQINSQVMDLSIVQVTYCPFLQVSDKCPTCASNWNNGLFHTIVQINRIGIDNGDHLAFKPSMQVWWNLKHSQHTLEQNELNHQPFLFKHADLGEGQTLRTQFKG